MKKALCLLITIAMICSLSPSGLASFTQAESHEADPELLPGLAVTDSAVWLIMNRTVFCVEPSSGNTLASLPLAEELALYDCVVSFTEDSILLCSAAEDDSGAVQVFLRSLTLDGESIRITQSWDVSELLAPLFDPKEHWQEIDTFSSPEGLFFMALDTGFQFHFFGLNMAETEAGCASLRGLGQGSLTTVFSAMPYGSQMLLAGFSQDEYNALQLTALSLENGRQTILATIPVGYSSQALNCAYDSVGDQLFFTIDSTAFRCRIADDAELEPVAALESVPAPGRVGLLAKGQYIVQSASGALIFTDMTSLISARTLTVENMTGEAALIEAAAAFNLEHPDAFVSILDGQDEEELLEGILNQSPDRDLYCVSTDSDAFQAMLEKGLLSEISIGDSLRASAADMLPSVREQICPEGRLSALPVAVMNACMTLNPGALTALTGVPEKELPHDWPGLLRLLAGLADSGALENQNLYLISDTASSAEELREQVLAWLLRDSLLLLRRRNDPPDQLRETLLPALRAFEEIDWSRLGLADEDPDYSGAMPEDTRIILSEQTLEIMTVVMEPGMVYWPLSICEGEEALIPQSLSVLILNPFSAQPDLANEWVQTVWEHLDILNRMSLCESLNEPVLNEHYEEDIAFMEEMIPMYEQSIAEAQSSDEAAMLQAEKKELEAFLEDYRQNAYWSASEESIALYRQFSPHFVPARYGLWSSDVADTAVPEYLYGEVSAEQFVSQLIRGLR